MHEGTHGIHDVGIGNTAGCLGGTMLDVAINKYNVGVDKITFYFFLYNFALVGTVCIFLQNGIPRYMTQAYLIATSVILAWQLAHFDAWTSWTLLVMLALYDLCAVLTPCGPLKWLIKLMTKEDSPGIMPGLLYEAELPADARRPVSTRERNSSQERSRRERPMRSDSTRERHSTHTELTVEETSVATTERSASSIVGGVPESVLRITTSSDSRDSTGSVIREASSGEAAKPVSPISTASSTPAVDEYGFPLPDDESVETENESPTSGGVELTSLNNASSESTDLESAVVPSDNTAAEQQPANVPTNNARRPTAMIPLAIAKLYRLRLVEPVEPAGEEAPNDQVREGNPNTILARLYTPAQLKTQVEAIFPRNGGRIEVMPPRSEQDQPRYIVKDRHGIVKRRLMIDEEGRVLEERARNEGGNEKDNTIKLGLVSCVSCHVMCDFVVDINCFQYSCAFSFSSVGRFHLLFHFGGDGGFV